MKQSSHKFINTAVRALTAAALVATIAFAPGAASAAKASSEDRIEARIKDMHAKLKITTAQEAQWTKVGQMMRDNEKAIEPLMHARNTNARTMTAVDDLKSYGEITDAHADGIKRFTPVFADLYASMSDSQKKQADALFRQGDRRMSKHKMSHKMSMNK